MNVAKQFCGVVFITTTYVKVHNLAKIVKIFKTSLISNILTHTLSGTWKIVTTCLNKLTSLQIVVIAPFSIFGLLFNDLLESLGEGTQAVATISSLNASSSFLLGVVTNYALTKYSCRQVGVVGSIIFFIGGFVSAFANSVLLLNFTYGILQGIGMGLMIPAAFTSLNHYFIRRRTFAMGITQLIIGMGSMILPIIVQKLLEEYGFRGTLIIISAIGLHSLLSAVVQQPIEMHLKRNKRITVNLQCDSDEDDNNRLDSFDSEVRVVDGKLLSRKKSQRFEISNSFLIQDKNISYESITGEILTGETNAKDATINSKTDNQKEIHTIGHIYQNLSLSRGSHIQHAKGSISTGNLNQMIVESSEIHITSQIIVMDHGKNNIEFDKVGGQEDDSAENLLRDDYLKVCYTPHRPSTDMGSTTTGNPISISDSRATVTSLRSWTSSCERRRTNDEIFASKSSNNPGAPNICSRVWVAVVDFMDLRLLLDPVYVNIAIGTSVCFFADITFSTLYPLVILDLGYSKADAALCISILSAADIVGRICVTLIGAFFPLVTSRQLLLAGAVASVVGRTIFSLFDDFNAMASLLAFLGFCKSFIHVPLPLVIAEYSLKRFPAAYGLSMVIGGIFGLLAGPFVGWIRDATNSYAICINTLNIFQALLCIFPWSLELTRSCLQDRFKRKEIT